MASHWIQDWITLLYARFGDDKIAVEIAIETALNIACVNGYKSLMHLEEKVEFLHNKVVIEVGFFKKILHAY